MWKFLILATLMTSIFVFLYNRGYMVVKSLSAVTFIGSPKGTGAKFTSCSGYIKRIVRFRESGTLSYYLDAELSKGDILVELLDSGKHSRNGCDDDRGNDDGDVSFFSYQLQ